jgi:hypothetical protein
VSGLVEYIVVYRPYNIKRLIEDAKGARGEDEAKDFMAALNERASKGFSVKNIGCFTTSEYVVFWALLEKTQHTL